MEAVRPAWKDSLDTDFKPDDVKLYTFYRVLLERYGQDKQWGGPEGDDKNSDGDWILYIEKQLQRAKEAHYKLSHTDVKWYMIKIAALAFAALEVDARKGTL